jgi:serine/threonine protein kinase
MPPATRCPDARDLERLLLGQVADDEAEALESHLRDCPTCLETVRTARTQDTLVEALRGQEIEPDPDGDGTLQSLIGRVKEMCSPNPSLTLPALNPAQGPGEIGRLAHYRVLRVLGEGGMGVVYLAEDTRLSRTVALKTMKPEVAADPRHRQRFLREARAAAKVEHDHIVPIYDVGEDRGVPWLAMPFFKGQSLDELLKQMNVLGPAQVARLGAQVAKGLAAAHAAGLIHRDVKPANIWIEPEGGGRAKLLDFGLARDLSPPPDQGPTCEQGQEHLTHSGAVVGTPAFMAPEQARGQPLDARADLFSLGCVLYRAVTGRLPFRGQGPMGALLALATETPPAPAEVNPEVPRPLSALIMNLLAKDRSARPASASVVAAALEALQENSTGPVPVARPAAPQPEETNPWADLTEVVEQLAPVLAPPRWWQRAMAAALLVAVVGALAAGLVVVIIRNKDGKEVARITVPDGGSAEIKEIKQDGGSKPKADPGNVDPDRRAAGWVLSIGGGIKIRQDGQEREIRAAKDLPVAPFEVVFAGLRGNQKADDAALEYFKGLTNLSGLDLQQTPVSDAGLVHLKGLTNLTGLNLESTAVTDAGLAHLKGLTKLSVLDLGGTRVGDAGLVHVKGLARLTNLHLEDTQVSDAGLKHLAGLSKLAQLDLTGTQVTADGVAGLQKALPKCKIAFGPAAK